MSRLLTVAALVAAAGSSPFSRALSSEWTNLSPRVSLGVGVVLPPRHLVRNPVGLVLTGLPQR